MKRINHEEACSLEDSGFVPEADSCAATNDMHGWQCVLVGAAEQCNREGEAERFGRLHIDDQLNFRGLLDRQAGRLLHFRSSLR